MFAMSNLNDELRGCMLHIDKIAAIALVGHMLQLT